MVMPVADKNFSATLKDIESVALPRATKTYTPVGHRAMVDLVLKEFEKIGRTPDKMGFHLSAKGVSPEGQKMLGIVQFKPVGLQETFDNPLTVVMRNSYDKSHSAGIAAGLSVWYCTNMMISGGSYTFLRKHTPNVWRELQGILTKVATSAEEEYARHRKIQENMIALSLPDLAGYEILGRLAGMDILRPRMFNAAMKEWKQPSFEVFKPRNLWSLYNAATWGVKASHPRHVVTTNPLVLDYCAAMVT
jgi:hypothetical protein